MPATIIADSSVLIAFLKIDRIDLLKSLFVEIMLPPAVVREVQGLPVRPWIIHHTGPFPMLRFVSALGPGESEAISLAKHLQASEIILDDFDARQEARSLNLNVVGTLGILIRAKQLGEVALVKPIIDELRATGFWLGDKAIAAALSLAGE